jgi:O-acetylhomoserine (thiol)-lyase
VLRARAALLRDLAPSLAPQNAFQLIQGLETLPLRIQRHFDNAAKVAYYLAKHPKTPWHTRRGRSHARRFATLRARGFVDFRRLLCA